MRTQSSNEPTTTPGPSSPALSPAQQQAVIAEFNRLEQKNKRRRQQGALPDLPADQTQGAPADSVESNPQGNLQ